MLGSGWNPPMTGLQSVWSSLITSGRCRRRWTPSGIGEQPPAHAEPLVGRGWLDGEPAVAQVRVATLGQEVEVFAGGAGGGERPRLEALPPLRHPVADEADGGLVERGERVRPVGLHLLAQGEESLDGEILTAPGRVGVGGVDLPRVRETRRRAGARRARAGMRGGRENGG